MPALAFRLKGAIVSAFQALHLSPDVGKLERILLDAAVSGAGVPGAVRAVLDGLGAILPGVPPDQVALARVAVGFALRLLHIQTAAVAGMVGDDDGDGEGPGDPLSLEDEPPAAPAAPPAGPAPNPAPGPPRA